jgi:DNA-binding beta-propeller fold protein YncE
MRIHQRILSLSVVCYVCFGLVASATDQPLKAGTPILLKNTKGRFDFLRLDNPHRWLLLAHTGNQTLDVFDLTSQSLMKSIATGAAQDTAMDNQHDRYFVSVSKPPQMAIIDTRNMEVIGDVQLPAAADLISYNHSTGLVYVCNDEAGEVWVVDPSSKRILSTITLPGNGMEEAVFDAQDKHLFQAVKEANLLCKVNSSDNKVLESWSTAPAESPHGIALIPDTELLLIAGGNGKLVLMNLGSGKVLSSTDIAPKVDEISYDPGCTGSMVRVGRARFRLFMLMGKN